MNDLGIKVKEIYKKKFLETETRQSQIFALSKHSGLQVGLILVSLVLASQETFLGILLGSLVMSVVCFRGFAIFHDASHNAVSKNKILNDFLGIVGGVLCFLPFKTWQGVHLEHHRWTGHIQKDPVMKLVRDYPSYSRSKKNVLNFCWRFWVPLMAALQNIVFWNECFKRLKTSNKADGLQHFLSMLLLGVWIWVLVAYGGVVFLVLSALFYLVAVEVVNFPHHLGLPQESGEYKKSFVDQYEHARSCLYPKFLARHFLNNFNYHVEHHMFPHLPWHCLDEVHSMVRESLSDRYNFCENNSWILANRTKDLGEVMTFQKPPSLKQRFFDLAKVSYTVLPGKIFSTNIFMNALGQEHDRGYIFWKNFWREFWSQVPQRPTTTQLAELFGRQNLIHRLEVDGEIVGMLCQTFYDLDRKLTRDLPYFESFSDELFEIVKGQGASKLVTHEYLTVDPRWRKTSTGVSLAPLLMSLGAEALKKVGGEISVAIARKDIRVEKLCYQLGWKCLKADVQYKNYPCDLIGFRSGEERLDDELKKLRDNVLSKCIDKTGLLKTGTMEPIVHDYPDLAA
jgi:omega-6 fatty acid desaturase (delta-12 desaturase)